MSTITSTTPLATEVITHTLVRDIALPGRVGTMALITLDNGHDHTKPNTFGPASIAALHAAVSTLHARATAGEIVAVAITGKPFIFAVGADLTGVPLVRHREQALEVARAGHAAFAAVTDLPVPTFAFVNGAAMGGGVELSLSCTYRTISSGVPAVALPECFLGLVPGWGGCYLLPRLVGPVNAVTVIIDNALSQNRMLRGPQAYQLGMADAIFEPADFLEQSIRWAASVVKGEVVVERTNHTADEATWEAALKTATKIAHAKTSGTAPAPYRAIELIRAARTSDRTTAFAAENDALADLIMGDELRAGLYAFNLVQKHAKRPAGAPDRALTRKVTKVGIVGAGLMASQLAHVFADKLGVPVIMTDLDQARVDKGVAYVHSQVADQRAKGRISQDRATFLTGLVTGSTDKVGFADADFVIEAVFEEMAVKQQVFAEVEAVVSPECILATNTSSLSITQMASGLKHPERVVGFHFFNPVAVMPLLEIIPGALTDDATLATAFGVGKSLKKTTILAKDAPSFIANRLLGRFMGEFSRIVDEGTPLPIADRAVAGLAPMPPFVLVGLVGPPIALHNTQTLVAAFGDRFYTSPTLEKMVAAGKPGFFTMVDGAPVPDPDVLTMAVVPQTAVVLTAAQARVRILDALADEVGRMLDDQVAQSPQDIDLAMITGAGFSFWNGGLIPLLDREGASQRVRGTRFLPPGVASVPV